MALTTQHPMFAKKVGTTSPTSGGRSVGIVRSRTKALEFSLVICVFLIADEKTDWLQAFPKLNLLLTSLWMQFQFVGIIPKYVNFVTFLRTVSYTYVMIFAGVLIRVYLKFSVFTSSIY
jgi:hypothetical protein